MDSYPKTVREMMGNLSSHPDVGVTMAIKRAVDYLIDKVKLELDTEINPDTLEQIRQAVYDTNDPSRGGGAIDPMAMLFEALLSSASSSSRSSGSPVDGALNYIEDLQRRYGYQVHE